MQKSCPYIFTEQESSLNLGYSLPSIRESVSRSATSDFLRPYGLLCPRNSPGKNTGVGNHSLLWRIFPIQGWNLHLLCLLQPSRFFMVWTTRETWQVGSFTTKPSGKPQYKVKVVQKKCYHNEDPLSHWEHSLTIWAYEHSLLYLIIWTFEHSLIYLTIWQHCDIT